MPITDKKYSRLQIKKLTEENMNSDILTEDENDELFVEWSSEQLRKRSQELQLLDESGKFVIPALENRRSNENIDRNRLIVDELVVGEVDNASASTTSDSQVCNGLSLLQKPKLYPKKISHR